MNTASTPKRSQPSSSEPTPSARPARQGNWTSERARQQDLVVTALYKRAAAVPCDRKAIMIGGLPGADKQAALTAANVHRDQYLTISVNAVLLQMAAYEMIPLIDGLSPMDAADLAHGEAGYVLTLLGLRAVADGRNLIFDISMADVQAIESWLDALDGYGYSTSGVFVEIDVEESLRHAEDEHRRGYEDYREGHGFGGRYIPPEAIQALATNNLSAADAAVDDPEPVSARPI